MILGPVLAIVSGLFRWSAILMIVMFWQRSQEAEFRADYYAARVGGSEAAQSSAAQDRQTGKSTFVRCSIPFPTASIGAGQSFVPAFRAFVEALPSDRGRKRRAGRRLGRSSRHIRPIRRFGRFSASWNATSPRPYG